MSLELVSQDYFFVFPYGGGNTKKNGKTAQALQDQPHTYIEELAINTHSSKKTFSKLYEYFLLRMIPNVWYEIP